MPQIVISSGGSDPINWMQIATAVAAIASPIVAFIVAHRNIKSALSVAHQQITSAQTTAANQVKASVVSANRQKWVDAVREDIASFVSELNTVRAKIWNKQPDNATLAELTKPLFLVYYRAKLRLNPAKSDHVAIMDTMMYLISNVTATDAVEKSDELIHLGQNLFRHVWLQIKAGE